MKDFPFRISLSHPRLVIALALLAGRPLVGTDTASAVESREPASSQAPSTDDSSGPVLRPATSSSEALSAAGGAVPAAEERENSDPSAVLDPLSIMKEAHLNLYYAGSSFRTMVEMDLTDHKGGTRKRRFVMLRLDEEEGGKQKYFTYFYEPADVRRTTFMVWKDPEEDDARWIYVPSVDLVKRISASDKASSFVGSDFSYEDVSGRPWTDDVHELLREEELEGRPAWVIRSVPKEKDSFAAKLTWVGKAERLPLREEYYDEKEVLERVFVSEKIEEVGGHPTVMRRSMTNEKKKHRTIVTFTEFEYDTAIEETLFSERTLKNPPSNLVER